jgi:hypothetical protein
LGDITPDPGEERMQAILRGSIRGHHALSGYYMMTPIAREMALDRYEADWKKTNIALYTSWEKDENLSAFQQVGQNFAAATMDEVKSILIGVDFGSAFFGGSFVDAWNNFKSMARLDYSPSWGQDARQIGGAEEAAPDPTGMAPDFTRQDLGVGDHVKKFFGNEWDIMRDTAERQQARSGKVRFFSELLLPFEAGAAASLTRTGMSLVRATPAFAMGATRSSVEALFTATKYQVKIMAQVSDYPSWTWQDPHNWEPAWRQRGSNILPNSMGQAYLEEAGLLLDQNANVYAGPLRTMPEVTASIATTDIPLIRFALKASGINPSVSLASLTPTGKLLVAMNMQKVAAEELINTALLAGYDRHGAVGAGRFVGAGRATPLLGRLGGGSPLQKISSEGFYGDTGVLWQKVFENPRLEKYMLKRGDHAAQAEIRLIDDYNSIINIEVDRMLDQVGITRAMRGDVNGPWYVPHSVIDMLDLADEFRKNPDFILTSNPDSSRRYADIMDGFDANIRYETDPRKTLELYLRWAYRKVIKKQFADEMETQGLARTTKEVIGNDIVNRYSGAMDYVRSLSTKRRRVKAAIATAVRHSTVARETQSARERARNVTVQDVNMLDQVIQTTTFPDLDAPRAWAKATSSTVKMQERTIRHLDGVITRVGRQISEVSGRQAGVETGMKALQDLYNDLEKVLDELTITPHMTDEQVEAAFKTRSGFSAAVKGEIPITPTKPSERMVGKYFATKYGKRKIEARLQTASNRFRSTEDALEELDDLYASAKDALYMAREDLKIALKDMNAAETVVRRKARTRTSKTGKVAGQNQQLNRLKNRSKANEKLVHSADNRLAEIGVRKGILDDILSLLDEQLARGQDELKEARGKYRSQKAFLDENVQHRADGALWGRNQPEKILINKWNNRWLHGADHKLMEDYFKENGVDLIENRSKPLEALSTVSNSIRFLSAIGDFAMPFIQGQLVLATNPVAWAKMTLRHYQAWFDPTVQAKLVADNLSDYQEMARLGIPIGDPEFFSAMQAGGGISIGAIPDFLRMPAVREGGRYILGKQLFGRFQASYNAGLGHARLLLYKAARESWSGTQDELAQYIRNLTGGLDSRALGVGPGMRQAENLWMAFSPRLLRSTIAIVNDGLFGPAVRLARGQNPLPSSQSRRAMRTLGGWVAGANGMYILSGMAMGKDWDELAEGLNPLSGKRYLSHEVNGDWIGVGGQVRAILQLMGGMTVGAYQDPSTLRAGLPGSSDSLHDNPLLRFLIGRGAVGASVVGGVVEAGTKGDIDTLPYEDLDGWTDWAKHTLTSAAPFAIQGALEGEQTRTIISAILGARTSAETVFQRRDDARYAEAKRLGIEAKPHDYTWTESFAGKGRDWMQDFEGDDRATIDESLYKRDPSFKDDVDTVQERRGSDTWYYQNEFNKVDKYWANRIHEEFEMEMMGEDWEEGEDLNYPWGRPFREKLGDIQMLRAQDMLNLRNSSVPGPDADPRMVSALNIYEELDPTEHEFDMGLQRYVEVMYGNGSPTANETKNLKLERDAPQEYQVLELTGEFDFDDHAKRLNTLRSDLGNGLVERIEEHLSRNDPESVKQVDKDRQLLADTGYWRANEFVKMGKSYYWQRAWDEFLDENDPVSKAHIMSQYDNTDTKSGNIIRDMLNERDEMRMNIRRATPEVTSVLLRHGYGITKPAEGEGDIPWLEYNRKTGALPWTDAYPWIN